MDNLFLGKEILTNTSRQEGGASFGVPNLVLHFVRDILHFVRDVLHFVREVLDFVRLIWLRPVPWSSWNCVIFFDLADGFSFPTRVGNDAAFGGNRRCRRKMSSWSDADTCRHTE
jgi:hypothetical protein